MSSGSVRVLFGKLHGLDEYVAALLALERAVARQPKTLVLDFRRTLKAYPDGMLPLIATLMRLRSEAGFEVRVEPPEDETLHGVFDGVDWTRYLSESSPEFHDLPASTHRFIPVRPFRNASELQRLHENILEVLVRQAPLATNLPEAIWWALSEVMENVLNHAMVGFGWVQASTFPTKRHINILVVDSGIGIRESLAPAFPDLSDIEAIRKAIEEGATRDPDVGAGYGLTGCRRIVGLNAGRMVVYSGRAMFTEETRITWKGGNQVVQPLGTYGPTEATHTGTIVELQLRTDREVDLQEAIRTGAVPPLIEMAHEVGGELSFDVDDQADNLSTRQAGKRLRTKVMNFIAQVPGERVILDFSSVKMLSSSFSDEFVAKMAKDLGPESFWSTFELRGMNKSVGTIVWGTISNRLGSHV